MSAAIPAWRRRGYSIAAMRALARAALPRPIFDFADGGAEDEGTLRRNEAAFAAVELLPHPLSGAGARDTSGGSMIWMLLKSYLMNQPGPGRAMTAAFAAWSMSIMVHSAMRLAAISLAFSLALVWWQLGLPDEADAEGRDTHVSETAGTAGDPGPVT